MTVAVQWLEFLLVGVDHVFMASTKWSSSCSSHPPQAITLATNSFDDSINLYEGHRYIPRSISLV